MTVSRADLEALIREVESEVTDPRAGIYGPDSQSWAIGKEGILFLGGGKAALLQLAHPYVAHAVDQHSKTRTDPLGRFVRTFDNVFAMVFGDLEVAVRSARRVHAVHTRITGSITEHVGAFAEGHRYEANDEEALLWVHATLIGTAIQVYDEFVHPLSYEEKDLYWRESRRFARLFGIPDSTLPADWQAFSAYYQHMIASPVLTVGKPALELRRFLFSAPRASHKLLFRWVEVMTAGLLDARHRREFGFTWGARQRLVYDASRTLIRAAYPLVPVRLRYVPAYVAARRRLAGKTEPDKVGQFIERLVLRGIDARGVGTKPKAAPRRDADRAAP